MRPSGRNLVLIGMPGSGKTTVGRLVAETLDRPFFDSDETLERQLGQTCAEIIETRGEAVFRTAETDVLGELLQRRGAVIAVGGGAPLRNSALLRQNSVVVYLMRGLDKIAADLSGDRARPLTRSPEDLARQFAQRQAAYEQTAHVAVTGDAAPALVARAVAAAVTPHLNARILILNGPNLNLLGSREPGVYGSGTYDDLVRTLETAASERGVALDFFQSNHEGALIDRIQETRFSHDGMLINPGAYTHYSYAIYDALRAVPVPAVEVHLSDIHSREDFRRISVTAPACIGQIYGRGLPGYLDALELLLRQLGARV